MDIKSGQLFDGQIHEFGVVCPVTIYDENIGALAITRTKILLIKAPWLYILKYGYEVH